MKKFNQAITIEIEVDLIASQLLDTIVPLNPHRELIVEAIIGTALESGSLSLIYNAINGFTNEIDFKVGDVVDVKNGSYYTYVKQGEAYAEKNVPMHGVKIIEINLYKKVKVLIEYTRLNNSGISSKGTSWVDHRSLSVSTIA